MDQRIDLHLHTIASDGQWTPEQLIAEVQRAGIGLFAITDHDALGSLARTAELVPGSGLAFLPGVELSARRNGQLYHLLAYGIDPADPELNAFAQANEARLHGASDQAVRLLAAAGYPFSLDDYATYTWDRSRGGWKALNFLIDRGICRDVIGYLFDLFGGDLVHPQAEFPPPEQAIAAARQAGGTVILAHPGAVDGGGAGVRQLDDLVEMGLQGVECFSSYHDETMVNRFREYCRARGLLITGGSDCHGPEFGRRTLGVPSVYAHDLQLGNLEGRMMR